LFPNRSGGEKIASKLPEEAQHPLYRPNHHLHIFSIFKVASCDLDHTASEYGCETPKMASYPKASGIFPTTSRPEFGKMPEPSAWNDGPIVAKKRQNRRVRSGRAEGTPAFLCPTEPKPQQDTASACRRATRTYSVTMQTPALI
jgi:hypothetical protein